MFGIQKNCTQALLQCLKCLRHLMRGRLQLRTLTVAPPSVTSHEAASPACRLPPSGPGSCREPLRSLTVRLASTAHVRDEGYGAREAVELLADYRLQTTACRLASLAQCRWRACAVNRLNRGLVP